MTYPELLDELGIPKAEHGESQHVTEGWTGIDCPRCSPGESKFKAGYSPRGFLRCWTCGPLPLAATLAEASGRPLGSVLRLLGGLNRPEPYLDPETRPTGRLTLPKGVGPLLPAHAAYLRGRGFDPAELERLWGVRGIGLAARLAWRLFLPVQYKGKTVSWTTRAIGEDVKPKYLAAQPHEEEIPARGLLGGEDLVPGHAVVAVEGFFDAARVGPGAVWTAGVGYSTAQVRRLAAYPRRLICYDAEPEAQRRARGLAESLAPFPGSTAVVELDAKDPGSAPAREIQLLRRMLR